MKNVAIECKVSFIVPDECRYISAEELMLLGVVMFSQDVQFFQMLCYGNERIDMVSYVQALHELIFNTSDLPSTEHWQEMKIYTAVQADTMLDQLTEKGLVYIEVTKL